MEFDKEARFKSILIEIIGNFVREEANTDPLITVTDLDISPDRHNVTVLFTTVPDTRQDDALIFLKRKGTDLRNYVKKHGRLKSIPNFDFRVDYGERHRQHIDELSQEINKEKTE